ncbi:MAG: hypothetical protein V1754_01375, partial [Pseudomonadota bacterium]
SSKKVNSFVLDRNQIEKALELFCSLQLKKRQQIPGLETKRADVIIAGTLLVGAILDLFSFSTCNICDRGVRWGIAKEMLSKHVH